MPQAVDSLAQIVQQQTALLATLQGLGVQVQAAMAGAQRCYLYVDPVNGNDGNTGVQASPFKTLGKALAVAPQGRSTFIELPLGSFVDLTMADAVNAAGKLGGAECYITICPLGAETGFVPTAAQMPTLRFDTVSQGGQNMAPFFQGILGLTFGNLNVIYPAIVDPNAVSANLFAIGPGNAGFIVVQHSGGTLTLRSAPAIVCSRAMLMLEVNGCTIQIDPTVPAGTARLVVNVGVPMIISWLGVTLPAGVTLGSLIENNGTTLSGVTADNAPLSNLTSF